MASKHSWRPGRQHVLPHRSRGEAWKSPILSDSPLGDSESRYSRVCSAITSRVHSAASAAPRENSSSESTSTTARSWLPARQIVQWAQPARRRRPARRRSRRGRPGTTARPPRRLRRPDDRLERRPVAVDVGHDRDAHAGVIVYSVLKRLRLPVSIVAALVVAEAAVLIMRPRGARARRRGAATYFSATSSSARGLPQRPARALRRADGARDRPAGLRRGAAAGAAGARSAGPSWPAPPPPWRCRWP